MNSINKIKDVKAFQKPQDSIFSKLFTRKLSAVFTFMIIKLDKKATPTQVSVLSLVLAIIACSFFIDNNYWVRIAGVVLLQISFALDCSDGEIARIKNMSSKFGAWFDSVSDRFKEMLMFASLTYLLYAQNQELYGIIIGATAMVLWLMIGYLREAKKASWPTTRSAEIHISKNIYLGTVDTTIYAVCFAVIFNIPLFLLILIFVVSIPLIFKQLYSAYKLSKNN
ncbi:CDP-alcohol phosphatidyltransferase family protein [Patescibacteria group bacterium]|nr:CDP-alcohol phosphatidyltransferase family protein [Patescibacteria group bacterium]